jgi:hypothetical protein
MRIVERKRGRVYRVETPHLIVGPPGSQELGARISPYFDINRGAEFVLSKMCP